MRIVAPTVYLVRVRGHLDDHRAAWLGVVGVTRDEQGSTLTVQVDDPAELYAVIARLRDLGATLLEVRRGLTPGAARGT